jgi:hypothetical protein
LNAHVVGKPGRLMDDLNEDTLEWLLCKDHPWVRYRALVDLLDRPADDTEVMDTRQAMLAHPKVRSLIEDAADWPGYALKRHNDAKLILHKLAVLADFGVRHDDPGMTEVVNKIMAHQSDDGVFESLIVLPRVFGGNDQETWGWMLCDAPILLYALIGFGLGDDPAVERARLNLLSIITENGWPCAASKKLGTIQGPGRKDDPCPYANLISLRALSLYDAPSHDPTLRQGAATLLGHWQTQKARKMRMFGIGTDFRKLKYPFIWYDILHMVDTLSRFAFIHTDPCFKEMVKTITDQRDETGRVTSSSIWMAYKGWDFGQKREPSAWMTFLVARILKRVSHSDG